MIKPIEKASKWTPPKKLVPRIVEWSVSEFIRYADLIDCNPVGQRDSVEESPIGGAKASKAQSIIGCIFEGSDLGEIKLADIQFEKKRFKFESIDGGHRKRALIAFINNEFPLHKTSEIGEKKYYQLSDEERAYIDMFTFRVALFENLTPADKGRIFRDTNTVTKVNHQQMMNSYGDIPIANAIRETAQYIPNQEVKTEPHELFACHSSPNDKYKIIYNNINFNNLGLAIQEIVARIFYIVYAGGGNELTTASSDEIRSMYEDETLDVNAVKVLQKKVDAVLDFVLSMARARKALLKNPMTRTELTLLYRLYFHYNEKYGKWKIVDVDKFFKAFKVAMNKFDQSNPSKFAQGTFVLNKKKSGKDGAVRLIHEAFHGYIGDHISIEKAHQLNEWMDHFLDPVADGSVIVLDKKRVFAQDEIESALIRQMFKDPITGKNLTMHDAVGGHIVAHSEGGKTTANNLMAIARDINSKMGAMDAREYAAAKKK